MNTKTCLTPALRKGSIQTIIPTGSDTHGTEWLLQQRDSSSPEFKRSKPAHVYRLLCLSIDVALPLHCCSTLSVGTPLCPQFFLGSFEPIKSIYDQNFNLIYVFFPLSWCLMRLSMVQLVLVNLKSFYPMAGYDLLGKLSKTPHTLFCPNMWDGAKCRPIPLRPSPLI